MLSEKAILSIKPECDFNDNKYFVTQSIYDPNICNYIYNCIGNAPLTVTKYKVYGDYLYIFIFPYLDKKTKMFIIKIGHSQNLCNRASELKKKFGCDLRLLCVFKNIKLYQEKELHNICENLQNGIYNYKHKNSSKEECYLLNYKLMSVIKDKISEFYDIDQAKEDILVKKNERNHEINLKKIEVEKLSFELLEKTKQEAEKTKQETEKTKQETEKTKQEAKKTKQETEKTKQIKLQIELFKLQNK
jgi:GTPase SAR1 family protein